MKHLLTLITALLLPLTVPQAADATRANILFIIADDLGWCDLRCSVIKSRRIHFAPRSTRFG